MTTPSHATSEVVDSQRVAPAVHSATRPFYWSVRRELWENRSLYIAPLAVAALLLFGFLISTAHLPAKMRSAPGLDPMQLSEMIEEPYNFAALLLMGTYLIVGVFYCLDALHGERRDRSILFWKSLPVSDLSTVLAKASIPLVVLPLITFAITVVTQCIMLLLSCAVLAANGQSVAILWTHLPLFRMSLMLLYHLMAMHGLYYAPFYGWLLLVSAWARRAPFLWAGLPPLAIGVVEKIAFNSTHFADMLLSRVGGGPQAIIYPAQSSAMQSVSSMILGRFLITSGLWIGLAFFAACLAGAVWLRRNQGPI
ncbi:MAG TPA: ABC transporter permease [Candidatus Sulfotelmatobacter sp.]